CFCDPNICEMAAVPSIPSAEQGVAIRRRATFATRLQQRPGNLFSEQLLHLKISIDYYLYTQLLFPKLKAPERASCLGGHHAVESGIRRIARTVRSRQKG